MSEAMPEKQQYLEGPWERVSGPVPLTEFELEGWKENLDNMYGAENWRAVPVNERSKQFNIVASPDYNSVYAGMARSYDRQGMSDDPHVQEILAKRALEEHGPITDPHSVEPNNRAALKEQDPNKDPTYPLGENPDFSNPVTIHNLLLRTIGLHKGTRSPLESTVAAGLGNVAKDFLSEDLTDRARALRVVNGMLPGDRGKETVFETTTYSPEEIKAGLARVMSGFPGENADYVRSSIRESFGIPLPAEDNAEVTARTTLNLDDPQEEEVAFNLINLGFAIYKHAEEQHKVTTPDFIWSDEHMSLMMNSLAQAGIIDGSIEQQVAIVNGVKEKLLAELQTAIKANERIVNNLRSGAHAGLKAEPGTGTNTSGASEPTGSRTRERESTLSDTERDFYKKLGILLINNQGFMKQPSPEQPSGMSKSFSGVNAELVALRSEGQSEKKALRTLAKKYHSDINHEPEAGEKMRVVTQRLEELNRRGNR